MRAAGRKVETNLGRETFLAGGRRLASRDLSSGSKHKDLRVIDHKRGAPSATVICAANVVEERAESFALITIRILTGDVVFLG